MSVRSSPVLLCLFLFVAGFARHGSAEDTPASEAVRVEAHLQQNEVTVGEPFAFRIRVEGVERPPEPDLSAIPGLRILSRTGGPQRRILQQIVNGRRTQTEYHAFHFDYILAATESGPLRIPPLPLVINGTTYTTKPLVVTVKPIQTHPDFTLEITPMPASLYVGQGVELVLSWYFSATLREGQIEWPLLRHPSFKTRPLPIAPLRRQDSEPVRLEIEGEAFEGVVDAVARDGRQARRLRVRVLTIPTEPGAFALEPANGICRVLTGYRDRDTAADPFAPFLDDALRGSPFEGHFRRREPVYGTFHARSEPAHVRVLPLPDEGRPPLFTGLIGTIHLQATADPTHVRVGDPLTLRLAVTGAPDPEAVELPPLASVPGLQEGFRLPREHPHGTTAGAARIYEITLRALHAGVTEIPAISLPYFNPESGTYAHATSSAIPLQVDPVSHAGVRDLTGAQHDPLTDGSPAEANPDTPAPPRPLAALEQATSMWWPTDRVGGGWLVILLAPPFAFLVLASRSIRARRRDERGRQRARRAALPALRHALDTVASASADVSSASHATACAQAFRAYLVARVDPTCRTQTSGELLGLLAERGVDAGLRADLAACLATLETAHYGTVPIPADLPARLYALAEAMERRLPA